MSVLALFFVACRSTYGNEAGTDGDTDPLEACKTCENEECAATYAACEADPGCMGCVDRPFAFDCFSNQNFRNLGACSCFDCATECDHMCPAGFGACQACGVSACVAETTACTMTDTCTSCLSNSTAPGCAEDPDFQSFLACACANCGQECVWSCPDAVTACSTCAVGACNEEYGACLQDAVCSACGENPAGEGCADDPLTQAATACVCAACNDTCGIIFRCDA